MGQSSEEMSLWVVMVVLLIHIGKLTELLSKIPGLLMRVMHYVLNISSYK